MTSFHHVVVRYARPPVRGYVRFHLHLQDETPWQALQRELEEELEWVPEHGTFMYDCVNPEVPCRDHFFAVPFTGNRQHLVLHEGQALGWFTFAELKYVDFRGFQVEQHLIRAGICGALNASIFNAGP